MLKNVTYRGQMSFVCLLTRSYASVRRKGLDWTPVFDPNTPKKQALKLFKKCLLQSIERDNTPAEHSPASRAIQVLSSERKVSTKELCGLIMQHRIDEHSLWKAIEIAIQSDLGNVVVPKKIGRQNTQSNGKKQQQLLKIRPQKKDSIQKVLNKIQSVESHQQLSDSATIFPNHGAPIDKKDASEARSDQPQGIDVKSLEKYLHKVEEQGSKRRKYAWEQAKKYNWELNFQGPLDLSAGQILFTAPGDRRVKKNLISKLLPLVSSTAAHLPQKLAADEQKELLVYELATKTKRITALSDDNSLFNINYKDLFGIINSSGSAPEETLSVINQFESEGWKLIGDLYDQSQNLVFQRVVQAGNNPSERTVSHKKSTWLWTTVIIAIFYGSYEFVSKKASVAGPQGSSASD